MGSSSTRFRAEVFVAPRGLASLFLALLLVAAAGLAQASVPAVIRQNISAIESGRTLRIDE